LLDIRLAVDGVVQEQGLGEGWGHIAAVELAAVDSLEGVGMNLT